MVQPHAPCWCNLTYHAVEQYIARWEPSKNRQEAEEELFALLSSAKQSGKSPLGDPIFISGERPEIRMVVKDRNVCVTVLPPGYNDDIDLMLQEELEDRVFLVEQRRLALEAEIASLEAEKIVIDEQRKELGEKKHRLSNQIDVLRYRLKKDLI